MWDFIGDCLESILNWIGVLLDKMIELVLGNLLAPNVIKNIETGIAIYNSIIGDAVSMLTMNPAEWNEAGWNFIASEVYPIFLMVACPLVVIFFLAGLCEESIDPKMQGNIPMETLLVSFFKLSIAEFVTVYALYIVCALFSFVDFLTDGWVGDNVVISADLGFTLNEVQTLSGLTLGLTYLVSLLYLIVLVVVVCIIVYSAAIRFFKILSLIPFGALTSSTIAGGREVRNTAIHFWKYMISVVLEAVLMLLMLALFARVQSSFELIHLQDELEILGVILNRMIMALLCLGSVKGAGSVLQRVF